MVSPLKLYCEREDPIDIKGILIRACTHQQKTVKGQQKKARKMRKPLVSFQKFIFFFQTIFFPKLQSQ